MTDVNTGKQLMFPEDLLRPGSIMVAPARPSGYPPTLSQIKGPALPRVKNESPHPPPQSSTSLDLVNSLLNSTLEESSRNDEDNPGFNSSSDDEVSSQNVKIFI